MQTDDVQLLSRRAPSRAVLDERSLVLGPLSHSEPIPELVAPSLLHEIFQESVRQFPDRVAIASGKRELTYAELDALSSQLAAGLRDRALGPKKLVAVQLPRSIEAHATLLAVLKSGAAYVPLDPECPEDRVRFVLADCGAALLVTNEPFTNAPCPVTTFAQLAEDSVARPSASAPSPDDACYVIYTSGSTGRPKGVAVAHRSAAHLVRAEQRLFAVGPRDRVLQGFSLSFDAALEEIWLAFASGAALVVASKDVMLESLPRFVCEQRITVLSTVPTLLATIDAPLPTVRLLILGGEPCPPSLVARWSRGRRMVNTYGPTEATVIATAADLSPHEPVTIGRPIANYRVYILDERRQPVARGMKGEIHIGGPGLALGYVGHAASSTPSRFVACPFAGERGAPARLYATGDLGRHTQTGDIEFLSRADDQVKLRGVRIELGEIEEAMRSFDGIAQVVVSLKEIAGASALVAHVVLREGHEAAVAAWSSALRRRLSAQMVPAHMIVVARLPTLPSGKVDRSALPLPIARAAVVELDSAHPPLVRKLAAAFASAAGTPRAGVHQDFFMDLGGHSLAAAQLASNLRNQPESRTVSIRDIYDHPTPARLARHLSRRQPRRRTPDAHAQTAADPKRSSIAQALGLYFLAGFHGAQWLTPYLVFVALRHDGWAAAPASLAVVMVLLAMNPLVLIAAVAIKWLVVGRYRAGVHPLWGHVHLRHWLVDRVMALAPIESLRGTPWLAAYLRLLGARVGERALVATTNLNAFDLLHLGDDCTLGVDARVAPACVKEGRFVLAPIEIGARSVVGARASVSGGESLAEDSEIAALCRFDDQGASTRASARSLSSATMKGWHFVPPMLALSLLPLVAILPGLLLLGWLDAHVGVGRLVAAPLVALVFVVTMSAQLVALKRLLGKTTPGAHATSSVAYAKKWIFDQAQRQHLELVGGLYATLYLRPLLTLLGVRIGKNAEVSTASDFDPDLLEIGEGTFVADCVSLGAPRLARGEMTLARTTIGARAFVGNSAVVPAGSVLGADSLVGCLSLAPPATASASWVGAPPLRLPKRQASPEFSEEMTYRPSRALVAQRLSIELARVLGPTTGIVLFSSGVLGACSMLWAHFGWLAAVLGFPVVYLACGALVACAVVAAKWALVGRYREGERPLWSSFVWRTELVAALHENLADPLFNELLKGTPFLPWFFRAMGAKIGRRVLMATTQLTEYDLVRVDDDACLDSDCTLQTHLFEDRVMKMSTVHVGARCTVGAESVVLYGTSMAPGSTLAPLSLLMKGESLPADTRWAGIPAIAEREPIEAAATDDAPVAAAA